MNAPQENYEAITGDEALGYLSLICTALGVTDDISDEGQAIDEILDAIHLLNDSSRIQLRDELAGKAMAAIIAAKAALDPEDRDSYSAISAHGWGSHDCTFQDDDGKYRPMSYQEMMAHESYEIADAMLKARNA